MPIQLPAALWYAMLVLLAVCCGSAAAAQEASKPAANQNSPGPPIRTRTNLIVVRVIVRDAKGKPVSGLSKRDFQLLDNRKAQVISYFSAEAPEAAGPVVTKSAAGVEKNPPSPTPAPPAEPQRFTALFFDDYHLEFGNLGQIRDAAKRYVARSLDRGARVAVYSASGKVHVEFTSDRDKVEQALSQLQFDLRFQPASECPPMTDYQAQEIADNTLADAVQPAPESEPLNAVQRTGQGSHRLPPTNPADVEPGPLAIAAVISGVLNCSLEDLRARAGYIAKENDQATETTLRALDDLVRRMAETPGGERTIAMVSEGFLNGKLQQQMDATIDRALRAKVIINALDAHGMYTPGSTEIDAALLALPDAKQKLQNAYEKLQVKTMDLDADVLAQAAEGTGGIFIKNDNDFEGGLAKMAAPYTAYVLGFSPGDIKFDGKFHELEVKLVNPAHFTVQARRGYFTPKQAEDAATAGNEEMEQAVFSQEDLNGLVIQFRTEFAKVDPQTTKFSVIVDVDVRSIQFRKENGRNLDDLTFMLALFDRDGNYVTGQKKSIKMHLSDATLRRLEGTGITMTGALNVKPGNYLVRAVLLDNNSKQLGTGSKTIEIP